MKKEISFGFTLITLVCSFSSAGLNKASNERERRTERSGVDHSPNSDVPNAQTRMTLNRVDTTSIRNNPKRGIITKMKELGFGVRNDNGRLRIIPNENGEVSQEALRVFAKAMMPDLQAKNLVKKMRKPDPVFVLTTEQIADLPVEFIKNTLGIQNKSEYGIERLNNSSEIAEKLRDQNLPGVIIQRAGKQVEMYAITQEFLEKYRPAAEVKPEEFNIPQNELPTKNNAFKRLADMLTENHPEVLNYLMNTEGTAQIKVEPVEAIQVSELVDIKGDSFAVNPAEWSDNESHKISGITENGAPMMYLAESGKFILVDMTQEKDVRGYNKPMGYDWVD